MSFRFLDAFDAIVVSNLGEEGTFKLGNSGDLLAFLKLQTGYWPDILKWAEDYQKRDLEVTLRIWFCRKKVSQGMDTILNIFTLLKEYAQEYPVAEVNDVWFFYSLKFLLLEN
jgi:hypothetical protein